MTISHCRTVFDEVPRAKINPYMIGLATIVKRLQWDVLPIAWLARRKMKTWRDKYLGKKAIILCNGPSLNEVDFGALQDSDVFAFGLNKINLLFDRMEYRPDVIVAVNPYVIEQNKDYYNITEIPLFLDANGRKWVKFRENVNYIHSTKAMGQFARDCSMSVQQGGTVTFVAMQLAFHMGFHEIGLVGCDHNFEGVGPPHKAVKSKNVDVNHFDPNYFAHGATWQYPDLTSSELHYERAANIFAHFGGRIVNCTEGGRLELFERIPLDRFLAYGGEGS